MKTRYAIDPQLDRCHARHIRAITIPLRTRLKRMLWRALETERVCAQRERITRDLYGNGYGPGMAALTIALTLAGLYFGGRLP